MKVFCLWTLTLRLCRPMHCPFVAFPVPRACIFLR
eukprot:03336.XXX_35671_35775_1 [CDS] Oithona nana genome sequencing.